MHRAFAAMLEADRSIYGANNYLINDGNSDTWQQSVDDIITGNPFVTAE